MTERQSYPAITERRCVMTRIQARTTHRKSSDPDPSPNLDPRDPDVVRAKAIARSVRASSSAHSALDRKEL
jgi:hypothetical protein